MKKTPDPPRARRGTVAALCLVQFVDVLGVTVVVTALPAMLAGVGAPPSAAAPVVTGYAMCFGGLLLLGARLGDRHGHRRVLVAGLAGFGAAAALAATAASPAVLIAARCLLGAAAALSVPTALRLLIEATPDDAARRRALAAWSATGAAAGASGLLLGGALTDLAGWRAVFWIDVPLAAGLVVAVLACAPRMPGERAGRLDVAGAAAFTAAVMIVVGGASLLERAGTRPLGLLALAVGAALAVAVVAIERRAPEPLLPAAALREPRLRVGAGASALNTATTSSAVTLATLYLQDERGTSPTAAGLLLVPFSLCVVVGSVLAARLLRRRRAEPVIALGLGAIAVGTAALLAAPSAAWVLPVGVAVSGGGIGVSSVAATTLGTDVGPALQGSATGLLNTAAQLGTALGVSFLLLLAALGGRSLGWAAAALLAIAGAAGVCARRPRTGAATGS